MKKTKRFFRLLLYSVITCFTLVLIVFSITYFIFYQKADYNPIKIDSSKTCCKIFSNNNQLISDQISTIDYIEVDKLPNYVLDAFVSQEDKNFYKHNGIDYKRIAKAFWVNFKSKKRKQGASTISQQLIKNTHLTNKKTIARKLKEIALTRKMEKKLSKKEIIETYINIIYFGNNCYGINNASKFYFSKTADKLTIDECASLVGIISAPSKYSPTNSLELNKQKRNSVLRSMRNNKKISSEEYFALINKETKFIFDYSLNQNCSYTNMAINEASQILSINQKALLLSNYKIYTYLDEKTDSIFKQTIKEYQEKTDADLCLIKIDNKTKGISGFHGKSNFNLLSIKRQPGSTIKPVLVYAPAIEEKLISPATLINDEKIDINGYKPNNINKKFNGYISVRECLSKSLNIPAVKILSYIGIEKAKDYAKNLGINFNEKDTGYSIALGGMTDGINIKEISNSYIPFINGGNFYKASFIKKIENEKGKVIYNRDINMQKVFSEDTSYLTFDMLKTCAKTGTAKKLSSLNFEIGAKTGTVGNNKTLDSYCITTTTDGVVSCWIGDLNNNDIKTTGGNLPTILCKNYYEKYYQKNKPKALSIPNSIVEKNIDILSLNEKKTVELASVFTPERYIVKEIFSINNLPKSVSTNFTEIEDFKINKNKQENKNQISFYTFKHLEYEIIISENNQEKTYKTISNSNEKIEISLPDGIDYTFVKAKIKKIDNDTKVIAKNSNKIYFSNKKNITNEDKWFL